MEQSSELDLKRILRQIYAKKTLFIAAVIMVTTLIILAVYLWPKKYEAKSMVFIQRNVLNELIKNVTVAPSFEEKVKALSVVMKSRSLILKVIDDLGIDVTRKSADQIEDIVQGFQEGTEIAVEVNKETRGTMDTFQVSYTGSDPKLTADYVNALVKRYIEDNLLIKREEAFGANRFLLEQINTFKAKLAKTEDDIYRIGREKGITERSISEKAPADRRDTLNDELQALLKKKSELLAQYTNTHPDVIKINEQIGLVSEQLRTAGPGLEKDNKELVGLLRERDTTKKIYEDLLATLGKSEVSTQVEVQDKAGVFRILDPAIIPTKPVSPNVSKMILLALLGGIAAGFALIVMIDMNDKSVKSVETFKNMGFTILAVVPAMKTARETSTVRRKEAFLYAVAGLYLAALVAIAALESAGLSPMNDLMTDAKMQIKDSLTKIH